MVTLPTMGGSGGRSFDEEAAPATGLLVNESLAGAEPALGVRARAPEPALPAEPAAAPAPPARDDERESPAESVVRGDIPVIPGAAVAVTDGDIGDAIIGGSWTRCCSFVVLLFGPRSCGLCCCCCGGGVCCWLRSS
jgi:hypothetical protein